LPEKQGTRQLPILDNASWHRAGRVNWHHFEPKFLAGYSPDFNPIERLWLRLKLKRTGFGISLRARRSSDFAGRSTASSTIPPKPLPSALSGNDFWQSV
jgi:transposase